MIIRATLLINNRARRGFQPSSGLWPKDAAFGICIGGVTPPVLATTLEVSNLNACKGWLTRNKWGSLGISYGEVVVNLALRLGPVYLLWRHLSWQLKKKSTGQTKHVWGPDMACWSPVWALCIVYIYRLLFNKDIIWIMYLRHVAKESFSAIHWFILKHKIEEVYFRNLIIHNNFCIFQQREQSNSVLIYCLVSQNSLLSSYVSKWVQMSQCIGHSQLGTS